MGPQEPGAGTHVVDRLESYLLGDLSTDAEFDVEDHLLHCHGCRAECDRMGTVALLLAALPEAATDGAPDGVAEALPDGLREAPAGPALTVLPGGRSGPADRPAVGPRRERRQRLLVAAAALVLGAVLGGLSWALFAPPSLQNVLVGNDLPPVDLPGRLSLTLLDGPGQTEVQAVVAGMPPGSTFTVLAVTADASYVVARGQAVGGPQRVIGDVPVPADRILLVVAALSDGTVVAIGMP